MLEEVTPSPSSSKDVSLNPLSALDLSFPASASTAHSLTYQEAVERLLLRLELKEELRETVRGWGLRGEWLDLLHSNTPAVVMMEQTNPLPTIMSALDVYGLSLIHI